MLYQKTLQIFQNRTMRLKLLIASLSLAIIPVVLLGSLSYFVVNYSLQNELSKISSQTMVQFQERIEERLRSLDKIVLQQTFNPIIGDFLSDDNNGNDFTEFNKLWNTLYSIKLIRDDIITIYLYPSNDKWLKSIGEKGVLQNDDTQNLDQDIKKSIKNNMNKPYFWMDRKAANGTNIITLIRRMPVLSAYPLGYLIVDIKENGEDGLLNVFNNSQFKQSGDMLVITPSGNILSSNTNHLFDGGLSTAALIQQFLNKKVKNNIIYDKFNKSRMMISFTKSTYNNWQYMFIFPLKVLDDRYLLIKTLTLGLSGLMIVAIIITSLMMSQRFYRVIQNIVDIIKRKNTSVFQSPNKDDEFAKIGRYLEIVHSKSDSMEEEIHQMKSLLRVNFLQQILTENFGRDEVEERFEYYGIAKDSNHFTVLCIELDNIKSENENNENRLIFSAINVVQEITNHYRVGSIIMTQPNCCAVILNLKPQEDHIQNTVFHMAEEIRIVIERLTEITVTIGVGRCYEGVDKIHSSYKEAVEALQYQILKGNGTVIFIGQVNPGVHDYVYPIRQEQTLIKNLKMGNIAKVYELLDDFVLLLKKNNSNYEYVQQSFYQLIASSISLVYEFGAEQSSALFSYNVFQHFSALRTTEQIVVWLKKEIYPGIIDLIAKSRGLQNYDTIQKALNYIHEHFNEDISQMIVSDEVSIPASQFSKFFKEEVGMTFTDYIIMYRMERAKEILLNTDKKIGELAAYLRYNNSQNFIRVFKQFTGSTPMEYKKQHAVKNKRLRDSS